MSAPNAMPLAPENIAPARVLLPPGVDEASLSASEMADLAVAFVVRESYDASTGTGYVGLPRDDQQRLHAATQAGFVQLEPGTLVNVDFTPKGGEEDIGEYYVDEQGELKGVIMQGTGQVVPGTNDEILVPFYSSVVTDRLGRVAAAAHVWQEEREAAKLAAEKAAIRDTSIEGQLRDPNEPNQAAVAKAQADGVTQMLAGQEPFNAFATRQPQAAAEEEPTQRIPQQRRPLTLADHLEGLEPGAADALQQAEDAVEAAMAQIVEERGRRGTYYYPGSEDYETFFGEGGMLADGTAQDNGETSRISARQRAAATVPAETAEPATEGQHGRHRHERTTIRSRIAGIARAIGDRVLNIGRRGRHVGVPAEAAPASVPAATVSGRHRAPNAAVPVRATAPVPAAPYEPGQRRVRINA